MIISLTLFMNNECPKISRLDDGTNQIAIKKVKKYTNNGTDLSLDDDYLLSVKR